MDKKEMEVAQAEEKSPVEEREFTEEQTKAHIRMFEGDFVQGLLAAADFKKDEVQRIEIIRNGALYFAFDIRAMVKRSTTSARQSTPNMSGISSWESNCRRIPIQ